MTWRGYWSSPDQHIATSIRIRGAVRQWQDEREAMEVHHSLENEVGGPITGEFNVQEVEYYSIYLIACARCH